MSRRDRKLQAARQELAEQNGGIATLDDARNALKLQKKNRGLTTAQRRSVGAAASVRPSRAAR